MLNVQVVKAYTREEAIEKSGLNPEKVLNATQKWKNSGEPVLGTKAFDLFAAEYLKAKKINAAIVTLKPGSADTRENPYKFVSVKTEGARKYKTTYQVVEAELKPKFETVVDEKTGKEKEVVSSVKVLSEGVVAGVAEKKADAEALAKKLITENKRSYVVNIVKEVVEGQPIAGYGIYTPSKSAVEGQFALITE